MNREEIIKLCEEAILPFNKWHDPDSLFSQKNIGKCWALLKAGCPFRILDDPLDELIKTDENTIWLEIDYPGFSDDKKEENEIFFVPTPRKLAEANGQDWYGYPLPWVGVETSWYIVERDFRDLAL